jgi:hypothetical protein
VDVDGLRMGSGQRRHKPQCHLHLRHRRHHASARECELLPPSVRAAGLQAVRRATKGAAAPLPQSGALSCQLRSGGGGLLLPTSPFSLLPTEDHCLVAGSIMTLWPGFEQVVCARKCT